MKFFLLFVITFAGINLVTGQELASPRVGAERVVFHTTKGDLVLAFYPDIAPQHTKQILKLVRMGVYDNLDFYRIDKSFVVQLSDAKSKTNNPLAPEQTSAIYPLKAEFNLLKHRRGVLSMAHYDDQPDSAETSFSILLVNARHLDEKYTIFGFLEKGDAILTAISNVPVDDNKRPLEAVVVTKAEVVDSLEAVEQMNLSLEAVEQPIQSTQLWGVESSFWICSAIFIYGLMLFLFAGRINPNVLGAIGLLTAMIGFFSFFVVSVPFTRKSQVLGIIIFLATLALFKLMNKFESNRS